MFTEIPASRPSTPLLDSVNLPADVRGLDQEQLPQLCQELREFLLYSVGQSGGHFGAGLGVVELTVALHYVFNTPDDKLVWDVGHQAYPHKILTGRREQMTRIRSAEGPAAFPLRSESEYDTFGVGHSSTSISAAMGMSLAMRAQGKDSQAVAIIGDGAMTAGMAFEALNHAGHEKSDLLVILNDNDMAISDNVGALNKYFTRLWSSQTYNSLREGGKKVLGKLPAGWELARKTEEHMKAMVAPGIIFEELGFNYYGPINGHDTEELVHTLDNLKKLPGPKFLHVVTKKGKGFAPAEADQIKYHALKKAGSAPSAAPKPTYSNVFGNWLCDMAEADERLMGITPAMREGSDLIRFSELYPQRYFDVAIAEQHSVTLAAGLACEGAKPVLAIYSTFLQRGYDQLIHDVALQNLDVLFAIDRAGLVGEDGPTHHGAYDLSYLRCIPNMVVMTPSDENECRQMLYTGYQYQGPAAVRYPRGSGTGVVPDQAMTALPLGKGRVCRETQAEAGKRVAVLVFGAPLNTALQVAETQDITVADMRFVKPLDTELVEQLASTHDYLITLEENAIAGGAGSAVLEHLSTHGITTPCRVLGIPDRYIDHAAPAQQLADVGLDSVTLIDTINSLIKS
ncbi:1-deoxy-D-xylulose-5-phosphate synthase [Bacterioplanoides sp. SCSIO 12839]|uniref:1-deoxy-D-xylulose-5-phosphate synthase n=1 Tax=Bacterioplanoides sp. SCSIO 12839 TaxID=2829569 RepID=UPI0021022FF8|nr:1-deoxy-D-xylulose-5-phosphate synthase [Bacterioplanoides sp. SCSIO 12839]UTW48596.1 1-deoxy-D-xylulose-5-phosphate synthase [Bacterioplanoides sp. SCSIO 12839]